MKQVHGWFDIYYDWQVDLVHMSGYWLSGFFHLLNISLLIKKMQLF